MESEYIRRIVDNCLKFPERVAVVDNEGIRETTYGEILTLALKTVAYISGRGIGAQSFITVKLPPCAEYMAIDIGIWLSCCITVPMGEKFPQDRVDFIIKHCESALTIDMDVLSEIKSAAPADVAAVGYPQDSDGALLIYTSGSTGNPKGILHNHSTLIDNNPRKPAGLAPNGNTRFATASPFYFITILGSFDVLYGGGAVHILSDAYKASAKAIEYYVDDNKITVCHISPAVLTQFHNRSKSLRVVLTGGERLTTQHSQDGYSLYNMFGMSETGGAVMSFRVDEMSDTAPIGCGINRNIARVVDEKGNDVPPDTDGELVLKGSFCKCYYKDPERTAELYRDGWLHTGDLARVDAEGVIHYVNRKDWMLKINGQRVEPGEIETVMKRMPGIKGAIVKGVDNGRGSKYLCGYYTSDEAIDKERLTAFLEEKLPHYMVPLRFVHMDAFPINANGKIDRKNLPLPVNDRSDLQPLDGNMEKKVAEIFCQILTIKIEDVGANTSFFEAGGDSILIMRLCGELGRALHKDVPPARIYENPTVRGIARTLESATSETPLDYVYSSHEDKAPLVFIHTGSTGSEAYYALADDIKDCCSFSVIEQYNIYHPDDIREGIPAIAAKYIEILKQRQPKGPYNLGGWCYGGMIAYEMACQLKEAGEDMGSLILIDSYIMNSDYDKRLVIANQVERVNREYYEKSPLFEDFRGRGMIEEIIENSRRVGRNMAEFEPRPYTGRVHFFKATKIADNLQTSQRTYFAHIVREIAGGLQNFIPAHQLTVYDIPEHHDGMMSETGRKVISNRIRNIMETELLYLEADRMFNEQTKEK
ncbi:MAG: AMP-binding protein [Bacteroidia bacterium]|nr:AMP-binding protein [Bacteroidia bacterium]